MSNSLNETSITTIESTTQPHKAGTTPRALQNSNPKQRKCLPMM